MQHLAARLRFVVFGQPLVEAVDDQGVDLLLAAAQQQPAAGVGLTVLRVGVQHLLGVVTGVDVDADHQHVGPVGELLLQPRHRGLRVRAHVAAAGEEERDHADLAQQLLAADHVAVLVGQREFGQRSQGGAQRIELVRAGGGGPERKDDKGESGGLLHGSD